MVTDFPIQGILDRLVVRIVDVLPITAAGVTLISPGTVPRYVAASNGTALRFEQLQTELGEGPCVVAYETGAAVTVPDLRAEDRFPLFGPRALAQGMEAVFTFPLRDGDAQIGALDLYRDAPGPLDAGSMAAAQTLADVAAAYLLNAQARADLHEASDRARQGEAKHRRLAAQLAAAQRVAGIGSWEWDITADTLWWSEELCRICGVEPAEAPRSYQGYLAVLHPDDRAAADAAIKRGMKSGEPFRFDHRVELADGTVRVVRTRGDLILAVHGAAVAIGTSQDVTDLERTADALRRSERHLAEAQSIGRLGSWEWDVATDQVTWSKELCRLFGVHPPDRRTTFGDFVKQVHVDDRMAARAAIEAANGAGGSFDFDHRVVRPDGTVAWMQSRGHVESDDSGTPVRLRGTASDITERVALQQELAAFALLDGLTGLHNRRGFVTLADHLIRVADRLGRRVALLFIDMDGMKSINDTFGHGEGDRALVEVATFLTTTLRSSDLVARVGGDEFCVLLVNDSDGAGLGVDRIAAALRVGPPWSARSYSISLSVGVAWLDPGSPTPVEVLMREADAAMYRDKGSRRRLSRVLVVEDDANLRRIATLSLGDRYDVTSVATAADALAAVIDDAPDVLLLDLGLPDMDGPELLRRIRVAPGGDRLPVIVVTGSVSPTDELTSRQHGVCDYITKPYDFDVLDARIRSVLAGSPPPSV